MWNGTKDSLQTTDLWKRHLWESQSIGYSSTRQFSVLLFVVVGRVYQQHIRAKLVKRLVRYYQH